MANGKEGDMHSTPENMLTETSTLMQKVPDSGPGQKDSVPCLIPSFAEACKLVSAPYSCLVVDTHRRHIALSPMYLKRKKTGIQEQLNAELLKYSENLKGVPMAYDSIRVLGHHGDIHDDNGFIHMNIEASFVIFRPKRGQKLVGVVNKVGVGHVGCLVHGCFNASVPKPQQVPLEVWAGAVQVGGSLEFEVFQLDADVAGVLLIRGRLDKQRVQELAATGEEGSADPAEGCETPPEQPPEGGKIKKKKKKKEKELEDSAIPEEGAPGDTVAVDTNENAADRNGHAEGKRRKKSKQQGGDPPAGVPETPASDSSGYQSDGGTRKRKKGAEQELPHPEEESPAPKPKKRKKERCTQ
ncbi:DNA-directed RNA polymerase I subunit RPA43 [Megalops cyprinoides]|uniref:DNA-directed RNA polymerase I subunit RPA43 n=1 Tax=Megalops cyprinoides TaxID=118141 RepID=UPI0018639FDE|nr:DNA-directed RNA polymerase I subunit RPA43 [Megalops cyprinoides]XP_036371931.1 DNA-directed RNA polymerase I subunit RPA43 [Megalops cyprinoides]